MICPKCKDNNLIPKWGRIAVRCDSCGYHDKLENFLRIILENYSVERIFVDKFIPIRNTFYDITKGKIKHRIEFLNNSKGSIRVVVHTSNPHMFEDIAKKLKDAYGGYIYEFAYNQKGISVQKHSNTCPACGQSDRVVIPFSNAPWLMICANCHNYQVAFVHFVADKLTTEGFFCERGESGNTITIYSPKSAKSFWPFRKKVVEISTENHEIDGDHGELVIKLLKADKNHNSTEFSFVMSIFNRMMNKNMKLIEE